MSLEDVRSFTLTLVAITQVYLIVQVHRLREGSAPQMVDPFRAEKRVRFLEDRVRRLQERVERLETDLGRRDH
ncbi:MAG: hypothetical protein CML02_02375 [Pseudooceanicola sp.]|nr:hypothetical protein [Pseudooceanicola sp.]